MAAVLLEPPVGSPRVVRVWKPLTTLGSAAENDIVVERAGLEPTHAQIVKEHDDFVVVAIGRDLTVNGRRTKRRRLEDRDLLRIGELRATWFTNEGDAPRPREAPAAPARPNPMSATMTTEAIEAYRRVLEFSRRLLAGASTGALVEGLLDALIELTGADRGFLVLLDDKARPVVGAARNVDRLSLEPSIADLSDSILRRVLETREPLVLANVADAAPFNASSSVVNLNLQSVMCCPLLQREQLLGAIYLGNHQRIGHAFHPAAMDLMSVFAAQASLLLSQSQRIEELSRQKSALEDELEGLKLGSIVGASESMKEIFRKVRKIAPTDVAVLITGETGTGKELIAREIHRASRRAAGPFITVNAGAIPEGLLESELFGHVKGAFTGAVQNKLGRFQAADGGTLFLDEIGEMPLPLQVKLLRALQEHVVERVGATKPEPVDIRVVAATNRKLEDEVAAGRFREDLFYRLNVVGLHLPPLSARGDDLELIARYLLGRAAKEFERPIVGFSKPCLQAMRRYRWPGNVRQLENRIKKAVVLAEGPELTAEDLDLRPEDVEEILPLAEARARFEARYIAEALERNGGNRTKTARDLGVDPRTIFRHLAKDGGEGPDPADQGST